jgi:hypothetical protein
MPSDRADERGNDIAAFDNRDRSFRLGEWPPLSESGEQCTALARGFTRFDRSGARRE